MKIDAMIGAALVIGFLFMLVVDQSAKSGNLY